MPIDVIPFTNAQQPGASPLAGASPEAINVVIDARGAVRRRPCIMATDWGPLFSGGETEAPVVGLHKTAAGALYAVTGNLPGTVNLWRVVDGGAVDLSAGPGASAATKRPIFAETEAILAMTTGLTVRKVELSSDAHSQLTNAPYASHVIANNSRLLANNVVVDRSRVNYSAPATGSSFAGHEIWSPGTQAIGESGFFSAEARPDSVEALGENSAEVFAFGTTSFQTFSPDSNTIYTAGVTREFGISAPYSLVKDDQSFAFLDDRRRIIHTDGRSVTVLSEELKPIFDTFARIDDCYGYRVVTGPVDALVWTFPSDGRTFAYQRGGGWSTWMSWSDTLANWVKWPVTAHVLSASRNIVGMSDGSLGELDYTANTDFGDRVPAHVTTGFLNRDTDARKHCRSVMLSLKRGETTSSEPIAFLSYRDDGGSWKAPLPISMGQSGDRDIVVTFRSLGTYRRRQWRFSFHGTEELVLAGAQEEYEVLAA